MKYELSELALEDIDLIWEYTVQNWSITQAEKYYTDIISTIDLICQNPEIGRSLSEVNTTHKRKNIGSHMIIYKLQNNMIFVDRILHQKMDLESQLSG